VIVRCNVGCKLNDGTTECKLEVSTNKAVCMECGEDIVDISDFAKQSMKINGDIIDNVNKRSFVFKCETHDLMTKVYYNNSRLKGKDCPDGEDCLINITESMKAAVMEYGNDRDS